MPKSVRVLFLLALAPASLGGVTTAEAQLLRPPRADVTALVSADGLAPGTSVRVALRVQLPKGLHVNSNTPRDPSLIPVVLTVEPPPNVSVEEIVYPEATDLAQKGADQPLAVYLGAIGLPTYVILKPRSAPSSKLPTS